MYGGVRATWRNLPWLSTSRYTFPRLSTPPNVDFGMPKSRGWAPKFPVLMRMNYLRDESNFSW